MGLRQGYTLFAPFYDRLIARATERLRQDSLRRLGEVEGRTILVCGIGSGLDLPLLPAGAAYVGLDLTPAMLRRARHRAEALGVDIRLLLGDAMALPFAAAAFDALIMHLILAVVPRPAEALAEAERVLKPGGRILFLDKFLRPGERAPLRRLASPLLGAIATRTDVVFEEVLAGCPQLSVESDVPVLARGWFRHIVLRKAG